jgi:hypothetical protein
MTASSRSFFAVARCLLFSATVAVPGFTWGCGGEVPSQATLDDAAKARVQAAQDAQKEFMAKQKAAKKSTRKAGTGTQ